MATFVATQLALEPLERLRRGSERRFGVALVSALTVFAVLVGGYHPFAEDGGLYVAGVKRLLDPALYPMGTAFVTAPMRHSLFAPMVAGIVRGTHVGLPWVLLGLHVASVWATLLAAWMLAGRCWATREARVGAVALLACWLGLPVAGTALFLMDPYVTARSFSTPCMVLALVGALEIRRRWGWALWLGSLTVAAAMHPLMAAYALGASVMLLCLRAGKVWAAIGLVGMGIAVAAAVQAGAPAESAEVVRIAMTRSYWFLAEWRWFEWVGLVAPMGILVAGSLREWRLAWDGSARTQISESRPFDRLRSGCGAAGVAVAQMAVAVGTSAVVVAMVFARAGAASHLVARMQPLRVFQTVYVVMALFLGAKLGEVVLRRSAWRWGVAMAVLGGTMFVAARGAYADSAHLEMPWRATGNAWVEAFVWVREHTPKNALFALDADYINAPGEDAQCFRAIAERSALADYSKDGGEASIAPELTSEWVAEQRVQVGLSRVSDAERLRRLGPMGVTWVVLQAGAKTGFECPFRNGVVEVCRLR